MKLLESVLGILILVEFSVGDKVEEEIEVRRVYKECLADCRAMRNDSDYDRVRFKHCIDGCIKPMRLFFDLDRPKESSYYMDDDDDEYSVEFDQEMRHRRRRRHVPDYKYNREP